MNKYQTNLLERNVDTVLASQKGDGSVKFVDDTIQFTQNEDYNITNYLFKFSNPAVDKVIVDGKKYVGKDGLFEIDIDFNNKKRNAIIIFKSGLAENCELALSYVDADKNSYDKKVALEKEQQCLKKMHATVRVGEDLVNLYWCKATANYKKSIVKLYAQENRFNRNEKFFMEKYEIPEDLFYKSITGLAFGDYAIEIEQYDAGGELIVSYRQSFTITNYYELMNKVLCDKLDDVKKRVAPLGPIHIG